MRELINMLNAAQAAYDEGKPYISDRVYDDAYFRLMELEKSTGQVFSDSPTQKVAYKTVTELRKITHYSPMLSLDKTKSIDEMRKFIGNQPYVISYKLDGLTCRLTYHDGRLVQAETRGNGEIGDDIFHSACVIKSIPKRIPRSGIVVVDGEVICKYNDFKEFAEEYKNPRNFAAGSLRLLDAREVEKRKLTFVAWDMVEGDEDENSYDNRLGYLMCYGFEVVPHICFYNAKDFNEDIIETCKMRAQNQYYPIDGMVVRYDDVAYGRSLGATGHHNRYAMAFKFYDEEFETRLLGIDWSMGRFGDLTPVAIVEPVEIDGTIVTRANLHNIRVLHETLGLKPFIGQEVWIAKMNMIIPQIVRANWAQPQATKQYLLYITTCPCCGSETRINGDELTCNNPDCPGKIINILDHFCGKKGLDIRGLSKATLEKLLSWGWVEKLSDIFTLQKYAKEWKQKPGFGEKSVENILAAIETARTASTLEAFISSLGIPLIGRTMTKELLKHISSYEELREKVNNDFDFSQYPNFGYEKGRSLLDYNYTEADKLYALMRLVAPIEKEKKESLAGLVFCVTGTVNHFKNRTELTKAVEMAGGKVTSSVSKNTNYLVNNDAESTSAKNLTAKKLGIPIISEEKLLEMI